MKKFEIEEKIEKFDIKKELEKLEFEEMENLESVD